MFKRINSDSFQPVEFLSVRLPGQDPTAAIRLTNAGQRGAGDDAGVFTWDGSEWTNVHMSRGIVDEKLASSAGEVAHVSVLIQNVDRQVARMISRYPVEDSEATLWLTDRSLLSYPSEVGATELTMGEVRSISLAETVLTFQIVNVMGQEDDCTVPRRIYQPKCNYVFGSPTHCGVDLTDTSITTTTTASSGSTREYIVIPSIAAVGGGDPNEYWANAQVLITDGVAGLRYSLLQRYASFGGQHRLYLRDPLRVAPEAGDPLIIRRMCNKTKGAGGCTTFQGDALQHGGFEEVPPVRFVPNEERIDD